PEGQELIKNAPYKHKTV
ncbi:jg18642, partial [Pararge aegeria aegeria]